MSLQPHILILSKNTEEIKKEIKEKLAFLESLFTLFFLDNTNIDNIGNYLATKHIGVILLIGNNKDAYNNHITQYGERYVKLLIYRTADEINKLNNDILKNILMNHYLDTVIKNKFYNDVISVFTTSYNSKEIIYRPYNSLLRQTFKNWEFVIIDDSEGEGSAETKNILDTIVNNDPRVKLFRYHNHSGYIGEVKNFQVTLLNSLL
jgi:hypothetical protein